MPDSYKYAGATLPKERQHLVTDNMRLVHYIVQKYVKPAASDYEDIAQVGMMGLIKAAIGWDESKGNTFATYATRMILGYCQTYQRQTAPLVHYNRQTIDNYTHIAQLKVQGKSDTEIMDELGISPIEYTEAINVYNPDSLDRTFSAHGDDGETGTIGDLIPDTRLGVEETFNEIDAEAVFLAALDKTLQGVDQRQADIYEEYIYSKIAGEELKHRYFVGKYHLSQSYISRIISKLNKKYQTQLRRAGIKI